MAGGKLGREGVGVEAAVGSDSTEGVHVDLTSGAVGVACPTGAVLASPAVGLGVGVATGVGVAEGLEVEAGVARAKGVDGESIGPGGDVGLATGLQAATRTHKPIRTR
jgi:hypothetical protein